jgi:hypothetical protein
MEDKEDGGREWNRLETVVMDSVVFVVVVVVVVVVVCRGGGGSEETAPAGRWP